MGFKTYKIEQYKDGNWVTATISNNAVVDRELLN